MVNRIVTHRGTIILFASLLVLVTAPLLKTSEAHFGMVLPESAIITQENRQTDLTLSFAHPFENIGMDLKRPEKFFVSVGGKTTDLSSTLKPEVFMDRKGWKTSYSFARPGVYQFVMVPTPYWEPTEDLSIIHYTKTIIPAYGDDVGWDQPLGLPTEIVPLLRPFGNYEGNSFTGKVLLNGEPVGGAEVEVELYNESGTLKAPSDYHITQVVKADANGVFTFTCPLPGWWGFAALSEAAYTVKDPDGNEKGVELGAVLWVYFNSFPKAQQ